jgi:hypothetical protein
MWSVSEDEVGTGVDAVVGEVINIASASTSEELVLSCDSSGCYSFCSSVVCDDDEVALVLLSEKLDIVCDMLEVVDIAHFDEGCEGANAVSYSVSLNDGYFGTIL